MKVIYYDKTRQCTVDDNGNLLRGLDSAARNYFCLYCKGGITVRRIENGPCHLYCPRCGELDQVASKYAGRTSRVFVVNESARKSKLDLFGGE